MISKIVNLYEYFGLDKPENAEGNLEVLIPHTHPSQYYNCARPAVLVLPGGGYEYTSDREAEPVAFKFLAQGYSAFVLRYTCAPATYPVAFREAAMAMVYIRENYKEYDLMPDKVLAIGFSAGGHLCGCLATLTGDSVLDFLGDKKPLAKPDACGLMYPVITSTRKSHAGSINNISGGDEKLKEFLSLENRVTKDSVPAYIFATNMDACVPSKNALLMACAYEENGVPFTLHILEKGHHGLSVNDLTSDAPETLLEREPTSPANYNDWLPQIFTWLTERGFTIKAISKK
ncbi:MAG: alpha/beta hydrolase [Clostridia bacterium]|nr:alpha/beta hydrolase [Clostridia bacterium]